MTDGMNAHLLDLSVVFTWTPFNGTESSIYHPPEPHGHHADRLERRQRHRRPEVPPALGHPGTPGAGAHQDDGRPQDTTGSAGEEL